LFDCPVVAHKLTQQRIRKRGTERALHQLPTETFEERKDFRIGGEKFELIHTGGHTPGSSIVWMPEKRILFIGDLIFEGRYPFLATADVPKLMDVLKWIPSFEADVIVPGHGVLCGTESVLDQLAYIEHTWERTARHLQSGHSMEEAADDPGYPKYAELGYEKLHKWNIEVIYRQLKKRAD
jgi:cyclase